VQHEGLQRPTHPRPMQSPPPPPLQPPPPPPPPPPPGEISAPLDPETSDAVATEEAQEPSSKHNRRSKPAGRLWCEVLLRRLRYPGFDMVPMLIGRGGCKMRAIHLATNAKVRIRGRGSGYLEVDGKREAPVSLMVVITSDRQDANGFAKAVERTTNEVKGVAERFQTFCRENNVSCPQSPLYMIGDLSKEAEELLVSTFPSATTLGGSSAAVSVCPSIGELMAIKRQESQTVDTWCRKLQSCQNASQNTQEAGRVDDLVQRHHPAVASAAQLGFSGLATEPVCAPLSDISHHRSYMPTLSQHEQQQQQQQQQRGGRRRQQELQQTKQAGSSTPPGGFEIFGAILNVDGLTYNPSSNSLGSTNMGDSINGSLSHSLNASLNSSLGESMNSNLSGSLNSTLDARMNVSACGAVGEALQTAPAEAQAKGSPPSPDQDDLDLNELIENEVKLWLREEEPAEG